MLQRPPITALTRTSAGLQQQEDRPPASTVPAAAQMIESRQNLTQTHLPSPARAALPLGRPTERGRPQMLESRGTGLWGSGNRHNLLFPNRLCLTFRISSSEKFQTGVSASLTSNWCPLPSCPSLLSSFFKIFFWCGSFLKSLLNLLQYHFYFLFWFLAKRHVGSQLPDQGLNRMPCTGRWSLNHGATSEVSPLHSLLLLDFSLLPAYKKSYMSFNSIKVVIRKKKPDKPLYKIKG